VAFSEPSLDSARGVRGGVFFSRGGTTSFVSLAISRCELKEESAEVAEASLVGVLGPAEEPEEVGFERLAAWTVELVIMFDRGFKLAVWWCMRNGMTVFPDDCREGRLASDVPSSCICALPSLSASLGLRMEDEKDDDGGVGYAEAVIRSSLAPCRAISPCSWGARLKDCGALGSISLGVLGAVGKAASLPVAPKPSFDVGSKAFMAGVGGMQGEVS